MADALVDSIAPKLEGRISQIFAEEKPPGLAVGIVHDQALVWQRGYGLADIASDRAVDENTLFLVASISKTFTATAIVQLRDEGKLRLDDPLVKFLPEFRASANPFGPIEDVTIVRLLTHRSGLIGETPTAHWATTKFPSRAELIAAIPQYQVVIEPDSAFKYSNLAFALLGEVVARISGRSFAEYVRGEILEPLGMHSSTFVLTPGARERMATGYLPHPYEDVAEAAEVPDTLGSYDAAAGLRTSVAELAKWIALQFRTSSASREGAQILRGKTLHQMHQVRWVEPGWITGYALTWWATRVGENIYLHHSGADHGFLSFAAFNKPNRIGCIALSNSTGQAATGRVTFEVLEMLMRAEAEIPKAPAAKIVATPWEYKKFLGTYVPMHFGGEVRIEFRSGELIFAIAPTIAMPQPPPPSPLAPTDEPNIFVATKGRPAGEKLIFECSSEGSVIGFTMGEAKYLRR
jgi:D-alanyl-D-alanine carboxypeptidase